MTLRTEPPYRHGTPPRTGVLLVNLGSPSAPTAAATRRYLAEFLSDPRVVEIPRLAWWPILHGIILRVRPARSAAKYASIWLPEGSPLAVWTERVTEGVRQQLAQGSEDIIVGQWEKDVTRTKNKFKLQMVDVMIRINGKDFILKKLGAEL